MGHTFPKNNTKAFAIALIVIGSRKNFAIKKIGSFVMI